MQTPRLSRVDRKPLASSGREPSAVCANQSDKTSPMSACLLGIAWLLFGHTRNNCAHQALPVRESARGNRGVGWNSGAGSRYGLRRSARRASPQARPVTCRLPRLPCHGGDDTGGGFQGRVRGRQSHGHDVLAVGFADTRSPRVFDLASARAAAAPQSARYFVTAL